MKQAPSRGYCGVGLSAPLHHILCRVCLLGFVALVSACADGYPQNDGPVVLPVTMSQEERIEAMNEVGQRYYLGERWRYRLNDACELKVSTGRWPRSTHSTWIPLISARVIKGFDKSDKTHDIFLESYQPSSPNSSPVPLLTGANWADSVQLMSLAQYMQHDCLQSG
jgi:hypothetical protein